MVQNPPIEENGVLTGDLACAQCQYNLRTLSTDKRCPECGNPVADSIAVHRDRKPFWQSLQSGSRLIVVSLCTGIVLTLLWAASSFSGEILFVAVLTAGNYCLRFMGVVRIVRSRSFLPSPRTTICLVIAATVCVFWVIGLLMILRLTRAGGLLLLIFPAIFVMEGLLTLAARRYLQPMLPDLCENGKKDSLPFFFETAGYALFIVAALMVSAPLTANLNLNTLNDATPMAVVILFLYSRFVHLLYWLQAIDLANSALSEGQIAPPRTS